MKYALFAAWAALAGGFIPVMAVLNGRLGRSLGSPVHASVILFVIGVLLTSAVSLAVTGRLPAPRAVLQAPPVSLAGGLIVGFYVLSITVLAPRLGVGNAILFAVSAQIFTAAAIDHFGLFGAAIRPVSPLRVLGLLILVAGLTIAQLARGEAASGAPAR